MYKRNTIILGASIIWLSFWFYEADTHFLLSAGSEPFDLKIYTGQPSWQWEYQFGYTGFLSFLK